MWPNYLERIEYRSKQSMSVKITRCFVSPENRFSLLFVPTRRHGGFRKASTFFFGEKINDHVLHFQLAFNKLIRLANMYIGI